MGLRHSCHQWPILDQTSPWAVTLAAAGASLQLSASVCRERLTTGSAVWPQTPAAAPCGTGDTAVVRAARSRRWFQYLTHILSDSQPLAIELQ